MQITSSFFQFFVFHYQKGSWLLERIHQKLNQLRGDLGGFGVGSDFTWQGQADIGYSFSKLFKLSLGYRFIGIDYEKGDGSERFKYDVDTYGPVLRFGFHF